MIRTLSNVPQRRLALRAFSMVEAVIAVAIVGVMLVVALNTVGASKVGQCKTAERTLAHLLAQALMAEILQQAYEDPAFPSGSTWIGAEEVARGDRSLYDDVDDYHHWSACPPQMKDGTVIPNLSGWSRSAHVNWAFPQDITQESSTDTGVKRIIVTVRHNGAAVAEMTAVKTHAAR